MATAAEPVSAGAIAGHDLTNKSVVKAMALLTELGRFPVGATVTELAQNVRLSRPTVFRLLLSLMQTGFVEKVESRYKLGWKIARLGGRADLRAVIVARVQPHLDRIAGLLNETVNFAWVKGDARFELVGEASGARLLTVARGYVGRDLPLHASAMGKLSLAELDDASVRALLAPELPQVAPATITSREALIRALAQVRRDGFATSHEELEESLFALAVAVRTVAGRLIGMLAVTGPSPRMVVQDPHVIAMRLEAVARDIALALADLD
ncbi:MAG: IclR family transcriptional regulator [Sphingomonadales bacterium]|nr:IclR family transcriptional regulator [Sphingomonadales bacterium]